MYVTLLPQRDGNKTLNFQKCLHADQTSMFGIQLKSCLCGAAGKGGSHRHEGTWGKWAVHRGVWPVSLTSSTQHPTHRTIQTYSTHNSSGGSVSRAPPQGFIEKCFPYRLDSLASDPIMGSLWFITSVNRHTTGRETLVSPKVEILQLGNCITEKYLKI